MILTASRIERRSPPFRHCLLYSQLKGQDSEVLIPWRPISRDELPPGLGAGYEEAVFQELRRRRAFLVLRVPGLGVWLERSREKGFSGAVKVEDIVTQLFAPQVT